jgi:Na+/H+ antiporter NhaD/arsenite permease-like protein
VHVFVFFIFLVCNIGGSLTPLGNPPIFLGFLKGVDFLWTLETMWRPTLFVSGILLLLFYVIDRLAWNQEPTEVKGNEGVPRQVRIEGVHNVLYLAGIVAAVLVSSIWDPGETIPIGLGSSMPVSGLARDAALLVLTYLSWKTTRNSIRIENTFSWTPFQEVAILFAAIVITMIPSWRCCALPGAFCAAARSRVDAGRPTE